MKQELTIHNWTEKRWVGGSEIDAPAGGVIYGPGLCVSFQNGPLGRGAERKDPNGCFVETLISAAISRLDFYQSSVFRCSSNQIALDHLHRALGALESRTAEREERGVEGTHNK